MSKMSMIVSDLLAAILLSVSVFAQVPVIRDADPTAVPMGGAHTFTASNGPVTWSVSGAGSIDPVTGVYTPPAGVLPYDYSRGWQLLTNNSGYTTRIDSLPLAGRIAYWKAWWQTHPPPGGQNHTFKITMFPWGFFDNVIDNTELSHTILNKEYYVDVFNYTTYTPPDQPWIQRADRIGQFGWNFRNNDGNDHHVFRLNKDTGIMYEAYSHFPDVSSPVFSAGNPTLVAFTSSRGAVETPATPQTVSVAGGTGCWAAVNSDLMRAHVIDGQHYALPVDTSACGAPNAGIIMCASRTGTGQCHTGAFDTTNINTQASDIFKPYSNYVGWGADLGRSPISASSMHTQELYAAVVKCRAASNCATADIGHTVGLAANVYMFGPVHTWPAMGNAGTGPFNVSCSNANPSLCTMSTGSLAGLGSTLNILFLSGSAIGNGNFGPSFTSGTWTTLNTCVTASYDSTCFFGNGNNGSNTTNGAVVATVLNNTQFTIPVDTTTWGPCCGPQGYVNAVHDYLPIGAMFRLVSSFDNTLPCSGQAYCDYAYVLLNTLKHYGGVYLDGAGEPGWVVRIDESEFLTVDMTLAFQTMRNYFNNHAFDDNIEVVNPASIIANPGPRCKPQSPPTCPNDITTTIGRITVTATNANGSASVDVIPEGTAVGVFPEYLSMVGGTTFHLMPWVSGNVNTVVTYSCCISATATYPLIPGVSVSSTGLISAPTTSQINDYLAANSNVLPQAILTINSAADSNAKVYVLLDFWPVSADGAIRMLSAGNYTSTTWQPAYNDGTNLWLGGQYASIPSVINGIGHRMLGTDNGMPLNESGKIANWVGCMPAPCADPGNLYWNAVQGTNQDIVRHLVLPSGQYRVTMYNPPPYTIVSNGAFGLTVLDWELQGNRIASYVDVWMQVGATAAATTTTDPHFYTGYKMTGIASVAALNGANGFLIQALRNREHLTNYGIMTSGLLIEPVSGALAIQQSVLPVGTTNIPYSSMVQAYGGSPPYTYAQVGGSLPLGLSLGNDGTVSGLPRSAGTYNVQIQATDSASATAMSRGGVTVLDSSLRTARQK